MTFNFSKRIVLVSDYSEREGSTLKKYVQFYGIGSYVPERILSNSNIEHMCPKGVKPEDWTNDAWIFPRTGIKERRIAQINESSSDLMVKAAQRALLDANLTIDQIDLIVTSTSFQDFGFNCPPTCANFDSKIGAREDTILLESNAACAGFEFALKTAEMEMIMNGHEYGLVVSGDKVSSAVDYTDRNTCILFGDGAGAVVLKLSDEPGIEKTIRGKNTKYINSIVVPAGGSAQPITPELIEQHAQFMKMPGGNDMLKIIGGIVLPHIFEEMSKDVLRIKYVIPHQANMRIIKTAEEKIRRNLEAKGETLNTIFFTDNIEIYGNTSGSSVPLALDTLYRQGNLEPGDLILLVGFGAGFMSGANRVRWTKEKFQK